MSTVDDDLEVLALWARRQHRPPRLELRCAEADADPATSGDVEAVRLTGCVGEASLGSLADLVASAAGLVLRPDACHEDPSPAVADLVAALESVGAADRLEVWRGAVDDDRTTARHRGRGGRELDVRRLPPRRRGVVGWFLPEPDAPETPPLPPARRTVPALLAVLGDRPVPDAAAGTASPALDLASSGCTACGTCVRACPTDALALVGGDDDRRRLEFAAPACVGCRRCIDLCPADALRGDTRLAWGTLLTAERDRSGPGGDAVVLEELDMAVCERCRTPFAGDGALCPVCASRRADPFGSTMPPHLVDLLRQRRPGVRPD